MITSIIKSNNPYVRIVRNISVLLFFILVWYLLYLLVNQDILIPSPLGVLKRIFDLSYTQKFWLSAWYSIIRITMGFILGVIFGITLAVLTSLFPLANVFIKPIINIIKSTPVASFIILILVWIKSGQVPIFISLLMILPMIWANILKGITQTDKRILDVAKVYNFSRVKTITKIYIPSIMPYFIASSTTAMGFAWKAGISAEVIANTGFSIGGQIYDSKIYLETADLFAWTIVVVILSVILEKLMVFAMKKFSNKYNLECRTSCEVKR